MTPEAYQRAKDIEEKKVPALQRFLSFIMNEHTDVITRPGHVVLHVPKKDGIGVHDKKYEIVPPEVEQFYLDAFAQAHQQAIQAVKEKIQQLQTEFEQL